LGVAGPGIAVRFEDGTKSAIRVDNQAKKNKTEGEERMMVYCWERGEKI
jgi:hypothetical protein